MKTEGRIFYGWYVVLAGFMIMGVVMGMFNNCQSQFMKPVAESLGVPRATLSVGNTLFSVCSMTVSFLAGKIFTRKDLGVIMKAASVMLCIAYFSFSLVTNIYMYYVCYFFFGVGFSLTSAMAFAIIIPNWFIDKRGTAIGLSSMGSGVFGMIFNFLAANWISDYGWRVAYRILAGCGTVLLIPMVFFFLKIRPSDMGLEPLGADRAAELGGLTAAELEQSGYELKDAVKTPYFWTIIICNAVLGLSSYCGVNTVSPHLTDVGYSTVFAGTVVSLYMGFVAVGKYSLGVLYDRFGNKAGTGLSVLMIVLNLIGLRFCLYKPMLAFVIVGAGVGGSFGSVGHAIVIQNVFGRKNYATIYGVMQGINSVIGIASPLIVNSVFDRMGSYDPCYLIAACAASLAGVVYLSLFGIIDKKKRA